ncbi:MAG: hypothetical protein GEU73_14910 [Chloroflexi bacterium]|nr:hypothetical protein [Chloroflexota bacterium]
MEYTVVLTEDPDEPGVYNVEVPALPGCFTFGTGREEALAMAREAIHLYVETLRSEGEPVPEDVRPEIGRVAVAL